MIPAYYPIQLVQVHVSDSSFTAENQMENQSNNRTLCHRLLLNQW
ncbi:MAG: hypothetical protein ACKO3I_06590 [Synechococcales cyanobacterium]